MATTSARAPGARSSRYLAIAAMLSITALPASATVVELDRDEFDDAFAGRQSFVDDFESYTPGLQVAPLKLSNGIVFDNVAPFITSDGVNQALLGNDLPLTEPRRFIAFSSDASLVGMDVLVGDDDEFDVTVTMTSGETLVIGARRGNAFDGFFGILLSGGLVSITFENVGGSSGPGSGGGGIGNFGFDNLVVDAMAPVPVPAGILLLTAPIAVLVRDRRR